MEVAPGDGSRLSLSVKESFLDIRKDCRHHSTAQVQKTPIKQQKWRLPLS